jgi:hypothetical protein
VRGFRPRYLSSFYYSLFFSLYIFLSHDHLQVEIYTSEINTTDNESFAFRILRVDYSGLYKLYKT